VRLVVGLPPNDDHQPEEESVVWTNGRQLDIKMELVIIEIVVYA
jgi:hypothetical protein